MTVSFSSPQRTALLQKLNSPNREALRKLLSNLELRTDAQATLLDELADEMCSRIRAAAARELHGHGWHRQAGTQKAIGQVTLLERRALKVLEAYEKCEREALEAIYPHGPTAVQHLVKMRQAALQGIERLKSGPQRDPGRQRGPRVDPLVWDIKRIADMAWQRVTGKRAPKTSGEASQVRRGAYAWLVRELYKSLGMRADVKYHIEEDKTRRQYMSWAEYLSRTRLKHRK